MVEPEIKKAETSMRIGFTEYFNSHEKIENTKGEIFSYYKTAGSYEKLAYICIHGAGFSGLSFAQFAAGMAADALTISIDLR